MKSVRVFVSSTFLDMHTERDQLSRVVFKELRSYCALKTLRGHQAFVTSVALFPGARLAVSTSEDATLRVWDLASGRTVMAFTGDGELRTCAVTPDGATVVAGEDSGRIHFLRCS